MSDELLTVKEFATIAGVTQQAVYKQLNNKLKPFLVVENDKKYIKSEGLELFSNKKVAQPNSSKVEQQSKEFNNQDNEQAFLFMLNTQEALKEQLEKRTEEVEELRKDYRSELDAKNEQIRELQKIVDQQQQLTGYANKRISELEEQLKQIEDKSKDPDQQPDQVPEQPQEQKKRWWKKLF